MSQQVAVALYGVVMAAVIIGVDIAVFRGHFWERLMVNVGIVLVFAVLLAIRTLIGCRRLRATGGQDTGSQSGAGRAWSGSRIFLSIARTLPQHRIFMACPIPSRMAISDDLKPSDLRRMISSAFRRAVGTRPCSAFCLSFGDTVPLALKHGFTFCLSHGASG